MGSAQKKILGFGQPAAFAGECTRKIDSTSALNKMTSTNIGFGLGIKPGVNVKEGLLPSGSGDKLLGITVWNGTEAPGTFGSIDQVSSPPGMTPNTMMEVLTEGRIWVVVDADAAGNITPNVTRAFWRFQSDGVNNTLVGTFRHNQDAGPNCIDVTDQVLFVSAVFDAADILNNAPPNTKIAEVVVSRSNK